MLINANRWWDRPKGLANTNASHYACTDLSRSRKVGISDARMTSRRRARWNISSPRIIYHRRVRLFTAPQHCRRGAPLCSSLPSSWQLRSASISLDASLLSTLPPLSVFFFPLTTGRSFLGRRQIGKRFGLLFVTGYGDADSERVKARLVRNDANYTTLLDRD